ncbi:MAG UNVERIFIED_CONTAM: hypothetical protein LVR29_33695 [Microcystis novacekii LVE1205-3]
MLSLIPLFPYLIPTVYLVRYKRAFLLFVLRRGSLLANLGHLWRYNGSEWEEESLIVANEVTKFAYGSDLAIALSGKIK